MLEYVFDYTLFTSLCILIRGLEAVGASAFSTASYVFVVNAFPNNIGSVLVRLCPILLSHFDLLIIFFVGNSRNIYRTWNERWTGYWRLAIFGM